ncbi:MAG: TIGR03936 family radical SAM-associated protein [Planctomycetes bacterium]|nr:TIGR03936 family radical SAM-associated protein [Planctomycetota bacterium]
MNETILILVKFKIGGNLRFLSHAETVNVFQRACVRADIELQYSQGFNPRPKLSLPLPRSVAVESDDELLCLKIKATAEPFDAEAFKTRLCDQLPEGCELLSVKVAKEKVSFQPNAATYVFAVQQGHFDEGLSSRIKGVLASKNLNLQRQIDEKGNSRNIDVRGFLKSIELDGNNIIVECEISSAGSIRVNEILELLKLDVEKLAAPVKRTDVQWQKK